MMEVKEEGSCSVHKDFTYLYSVFTEEGGETFTVRSKVELEIEMAVILLLCFVCQIV